MTTKNLHSSATDFDHSELKKLKEGDLSVFEKLFRHYYHTLVIFAGHYVNETQVAQDVVQDVFLHIWLHRDRIDPHRNIKTYLFTAVKNRSLKQLRHKRVKERYLVTQVVLDLDPVTPEDTTHQQEFSVAIEKAIQALPEKCRTIFCMNRFDHLKYAEIAEIEGISIKTVETHMGRALRFLRDQLKHFLLLFLSPVI
jgi:RNA polymerase sigma-70 factor (ECF subfamily)